MSSSASRSATLRTNESFRLAKPMPTGLCSDSDSEKRHGAALRFPAFRGSLLRRGQEPNIGPRWRLSIGDIALLASVMTGRLRLVMVPDRIRDPVPEGYREKRAAQFLGVGSHLFRRLVRDGRIVPRLLGKTRIYLREDLDRFLRSLPVDREALKMPHQDPARLQRKEDYRGHQGTPQRVLGGQHLPAR